jgi:hypothetical protein
VLWQDATMSEEQAPAVPAAERESKSRPYVPSPGSESTREMREMSRRRRDAEEKLQQHLQEADQLHEAHMKAHHKEMPVPHGHEEAPPEGHAPETADEHAAEGEREAGTRPAE